MPLGKGWGGECEILAWGSKQTSDIALVTSCPRSHRPLRAVHGGGAFQGADLELVEQKFPNLVWLQGMA